MGKMNCLVTLLCFVHSTPVLEQRSYLIPDNRWTVDDLVDYYSPVMETFKQDGNLHQGSKAERVEALEHFLDVEPLSNHYLVDPTHHILHDFGFDDITH